MARGASAAVIIAVAALAVMCAARNDAMAQNVITAPYLLAFDVCPSDLAQCHTTPLHTIVLTQSSDGVNWSVVPGFPPAVLGGLPAVVRRGNEVYVIYLTGVLRYHMDTGVWDGPLGLTVTSSDGSGVDDVTAILNSQGQIVLTYFPASLASSFPCAQAACVKSYHQATEVPGSDGTAFVETTPSIVDITLANGGDAQDPFLYFDGSQFDLYVAVQNPVPQMSLYTSSTLSGPYVLSTALPNGALMPNPGGQGAGFFNAAQGQYWDYVPAVIPPSLVNGGISRAVKTSLSQQVFLSDLTPVILGSSFGPPITQLQHPHFAKNWNGTVAPVGAVLPVSRSVEVGETATAFVTVINTDSVSAVDCFVAPLTSVPATFAYQTTDPATNEVTGTPNTPVAVSGHGAQSFVIAFTPTAAIAPTDVQFQIGCASTSTASPILGVNTLLLSGSTTPVPDIVALAATVSNDGIVTLSPNGAFSVATVNLGAAGPITATVDNGTAVLPVSLSICETDSVTGKCLTPAAPSVTVAVATNAVPTFAVFAATPSVIPFDPARNRIFVRFQDATGATRGATSVAVRTP